MQILLLTIMEPLHGSPLVWLTEPRRGSYEKLAKVARTPEMFHQSIVWIIIYMLAGREL